MTSAVFAPIRRAARGGLFLGASQAIELASTSLAMVVLARLLTPEHFGLAAMAVVTLGFVTTFNDLGLPAAVIQRPDLTDAHKDAAFWSSVVLGAGLFALLSACAPLLAYAYREPRLTPLIIVSAIPLLIGPLWSTHASLLRRALRFGTVAKIEAFRSVVAAMAAVAGAASGLGYWALVCGPICGHLIAIPAYHAARTGWRPGTRGTFGHARQLFSFSLYVAGANSLNYVGANIDNFLIGRVLGPVALGMYVLAYQLVAIPHTRISSLFNQVMFPAFSTLQHDGRAAGTAYVNISRSVALITLPLLALMAVAAPEIVRIVYGAQWSDAVSTLRLLIVAGAMKSIGTLVGIVFKSRGNSRIEFYWNVAWLFAMAAAVLVGIRWGSNGVAAAISIVCVPGVLYAQWLACRSLGLPFRRLLSALALPAIAALSLTVLGFMVRRLFDAGEADGTAIVVLRLAQLSLIVAATYAVILRLLHPRIVPEIHSFIAAFRRV